MGSDLLSQHRDCIVRQAHGIQGVESIPGLHRRVRSLSAEENSPFDVGQHLHGRNSSNTSRQKVLGARVRHETSRGLAIGAIVDEMDLATATLLSRRTQKSHSTWSRGLLQGFGDAQKSSKARRRDEIVAAGMANARQRVIFCVEHNQPAARAVLGRKGSFYTVRMRRHLEAERLQKRNKVGMSFVLFIGELRFAVNLHSIVSKV